MINMSLCFGSHIAVPQNICMYVYIYIYFFFSLDPKRLRMYQLVVCVTTNLVCFWRGALFYVVEVLRLLLRFDVEGVTFLWTSYRYKAVINLKRRATRTPKMAYLLSITDPHPELKTAGKFIWKKYGFMCSK